jgi:hypothetical protein
MDSKQRVEFIRKGNELFNMGEIDKAALVFEKTNYTDGLIRIGDHFFFDKKQPLFALKYYKKAGRTDMVNQIFERMVFALGKLINEGKDNAGKPEIKVTLPPLKVSPKLKILAEEIIRNSEDQSNAKH